MQVRKHCHNMHCVELSLGGFVLYDVINVIDLGHHVSDKCLRFIVT